jgi:hypothetical protein
MGIGEGDCDHAIVGAGANCDNLNHPGAPRPLEHARQVARHAGIGEVGVGVHQGR